MQDIDPSELVQVIGGAASPQMEPGQMGAGGRGATAGRNYNPSQAPATASYALGGQVKDPGAFRAHYPGGGNRP